MPAFYSRTIFSAASAFLISTAIAFSQWIPAQGPSGMLANRLVAFGDTLFTCGYGLYRSTDRGERWTEIAHGLPPDNRLDILRKGHALYVTVYGAGVYRSLDRGGTWTPWVNGTTSLLIGKLAADDSGIYVATEPHGLFRSDDDGASWTAATGNLPVRPGAYPYNTRTYAVGDGRIFLGTDSNGAFRSGDRGRSWNSVSSNLPVGQVRVICLEGDAVFLALGSRVYRSKDEGASWIPAGEGLPDSLVDYLVCEKDRLYAGIRGYGSFLSRDQGVTWESSGIFPGDRPNVTDIAWLGDSCFASTVQGVYRSLDQGATWALRSIGLRVTAATSLLSSGKSLYAAISDASRANFFRTGNLGDSWQGNKTGYYIKSLAEIRGVLYANVGSGIILSADTGRTWDSAGFRNRQLVHFAVQDTGIIGAFDDGIFRSDDGGATWAPKSAGIDSAQGGFWILGMGARGKDLFLSANGGIYRSRDRGDGWEKLPGTDTLTIREFAFGAGVIYANATRGLYRSLDDGLTWMRLLPELPNGMITCLLADGPRLFVGTRAATVPEVVAGTGAVLYYSPDSGNTWGSDPVGKSINQLALHESHLFAGTEVWGVWRRPLSGWIPVALTARRIPRAYAPEAGIRLLPGGIGFSSGGSESGEEFFDARGRAWGHARRP